MKDVLKMIRFDYISVRSLTVPYVIGFIALCLVLALFGIPLGVFCFAAAAAVFAPVQELANSDTRKIYGILPIGREAVTRTAFIEMIVPLFIGELLSLTFLFISSSSKLYRIFPKTVVSIIEELFDFSKSDANITFGELCIMLILVFVYLCILAAYLEMMSAIQSREHDVKNLLTAVALTVAAVVGIDVLSAKQVIPPAQDWLMLIPQTASEKWLLAVILNVIAAGVSVLFCETAVKKSANCEI
ncbi:MAG: hypothetical protein K2N71_02980 [Oscillospiraceae bacterium]|nr:hypothetical protein [Oscillospiraceae bacterium]